MALNFRKLFEYIFKSFDVAGDTKLLEKYEQDGIRFLMLIKRHWIYSILHSWKVLVVIGIGVANAYLLTFANDELQLVPTVIAIFLVINIVYWVFVVVVFIYRFYKILGSAPYIEDIYSAIKNSKKSDVVFTKFFNQTVFLFFVLFILTFFTLITGIFSLLSGGALGFGLGILNSFLLITQTILFYSYLNKMINQEMDFKIIIPGQIIFYNQKGLLGESQSMNSRKIKTMNSSYRGLLGSFFNYGDIIILSEGDQKDNGEMTMDFIGDPNKTLKESQKVLNNDFEAMEKEVNVLLKKFKSEIGIENIDTDENKEKLREFILNNEEKLRKIFEEGDNETKNEVRELYILLKKDKN